MVGAGAAAWRSPGRWWPRVTRCAAVTRDESKRVLLEDAGCECWIGDPDRIGTLRYALENATCCCGCSGRSDVRRRAARLAAGDDARADRRHDGARRAYEGRAGEAVVQAAHDRHGIPIAFLEADPSDVDAWVAAGRAGSTRCLLLIADRRRVDDRRVGRVPGRRVVVVVP